MTAGPDNSWEAECTVQGLDPAEVRRVLSRYRAYQEFHARHRSEALALPAWFRFYQLETRSESGSQVPAPASGCSIDAASVNRGVIAHPAAFLRMLQRASEEIIAP